MCNWHSSVKSAVTYKAGKDLWTYSFQSTRHRWYLHVEDWGHRDEQTEKWTLRTGNNPDSYPALICLDALNLQWEGWWRLRGVALLCKLLDRLYPQGKCWKAKSSEVFNFLGVGFESLSCSQWLSNFTVPWCVPWMGHLCVLPAPNLTVYRRIAGDDLCFLPVGNKPGALISHTEKNGSTFRQPRRDSSFENLLDKSWYLGQEALKAGKRSLKPRQPWACWRPHASAYHL